MNTPFKFRAEELQFVRLKLSADMADHSGVIRYLENIFSNKTENKIKKIKKIFSIMSWKGTEILRHKLKFSLYL